MKKIFPLIFLLLIAFSSCIKNSDECQLRNNSANLSLSKTELVLQTNSSETLSVNDLTLTRATPNIVWSSSKPDVATVDNTGLVTATGGGTAVIKASSGDQDLTCTVTVTPNVYIVGDAVIDGTYCGTLWVNSELVFKLEMHESNVQFSSVYASGTDVYICGYRTYSTGKTQGILFKNGVDQNIIGTELESEFSSVYVHNSDVYVTGYQIIDGVYTAILLKNGQLTQLGDAINGSITVSMTCSGDDVYVIGHEQVNEVYRITLWKNGQADHLTSDSHDSYGRSVCVVGSDVYVAGMEDQYYFQNIALWKNGEQVTSVIPSLTSNASSVVAIGSDIYVGGTMRDPVKGERRVLWKNGSVTYFDTTNTQVNSFQMLASSGDDLYATGYQYHQNGYLMYAFVWKNGKADRLSPEINQTYANGIFVR